MNRNAESLYLCGFPAFVLSNGSSLALFVGVVMTFINQYIALLEQIPKGLWEGKSWEPINQMKRIGVYLI